MGEPCLCLILASTCVAGEMRRLTDDGQVKADPVFIPGGDELVYSVQDGPLLISLVRLWMYRNEDA